ncbi:RNA chaperone Hfq [Caballeronia cordobensis]|uniref:RNA chaperone Hfq n=1 Tax=Caballeronia cordobensis TaxID=1353886 RepID=UPI00094FCDA7
MTAQIYNRTALVSNQTLVWVFLRNGIKLSGFIASFDTFALSVQSSSGTQLVFKNSVSTVIEQHPYPVAPTRDPTDRQKRRPTSYRRNLPTSATTAAGCCAYPPPEADRRIGEHAVENAFRH